MQSYKIIFFVAKNLMLIIVNWSGFLGGFLGGNFEALTHFIHKKSYSIIEQFDYFAVMCIILIIPVSNF